jgi:hypothetical protein
MRKLIAIALSRHIGKTIDMKTANEIIGDILDTIECAIDPKQFEPFIFGKYTIACESFRDVLPELDPLHIRHHEETEGHNASIPRDFDYETLAEIESQGGLLQFTSRVTDTGELVGNMRLLINTSVMTKTKVCTENAFYVSPEHRGGFMAVRLWQYAERSVVSIGAREVMFSSKTINRAHRMADYLKYSPFATQYIKVF